MHSHEARSALPHGVAFRLDVSRAADCGNNAGLFMACEPIPNHANPPRCGARGNSFAPVPTFLGEGTTNRPWHCIVLTLG